ncbi:LysR family transcriptional regulator [Martelella sp. HB161492]|uniref:LysR family transcriptional regulator n=1 Tax=Martelella sp. HB161492 TaxID=2720726 RepID=UPI00159041FF|nr:LysR family transcriptional regulator [Martelella sp. HB161492]
MDRLTSMSVFVKTVDLGSFAAAAGALGISAQMVAKHVVLLEDRLGTTLLNRTTRRQNLTEIGRAYYERCRFILAEAEAAESLALDMRRHPKGLLRVNAPKTFGCFSLAPFVTDYLRRFPDMEIELSLDDRFVDPLEEDYEVLVRIGPVDNAALTVHPLEPYRLIACAAPSYLKDHGEPGSPADLAGHECLIYGRNIVPQVCEWKFATAGRWEKVPVRGRLMSNDWRVLLGAATAGAGIVLGPANILEDALAAGRLRRILSDYEGPSRPMSVAYVSGRRPTAKIRSFVEAIVAAFGPDRRMTSG